jgi:hypothetical protein
MFWRAKNMLKLGLTAFALFVSSSALATDPAPATPAPAPAPAAGDKMICKKQPVFGSLTRVSKTCRTKREWDEIENDSKDTVKGFQRERSASGIEVG